MYASITSQRGQGSRNLVVGIALILITIAITAYAVSEIVAAVPRDENKISENIIPEVEAKTPTIFKLMLIVAIVVAIGAILRALGVF